jgi:hypothetical protein
MRRSLIILGIFSWLGLGEISAAATYTDVWISFPLSRSTSDERPFCAFAMLTGPFGLFGAVVIGAVGNAMVYGFTWDWYRNPGVRTAKRGRICR